MENNSNLNKGSIISNIWAIIVIILMLISISAIISESYTILLYCGISLFLFVIIGIPILRRNVRKHREQSAQSIIADFVSPENFENYFNMINNATEQIYNLYELLDKDDSFLQLMKEKILVNQTLNKLPILSIDENRLRSLFWMDIIKCYIELGHPIILNKKEGIGLHLFMARTMGLGKIEYILFKNLPDHLRVNTESFIKEIELSINMLPTPATRFIVSEILEQYDMDLQKKYHILLYRFASITAKADNLISDTESKWLSDLMKLTNSDDSLINGVNISQQINNQNLSVHLPKAGPYYELQSLIGLKEVKSEIYSLINLEKIKKARESKGLKLSKMSYHCVFTGNPGTGKTTVARIIAQIYKDLGVLKRGHLVEVDRSGLVAEYVGQTAVKTNNIIDTAINGVLFIDEAYSLISNSSNDYGKEAIATLLKRMEDDRDCLIVILAGYTNEMKKFIDSNPGLQSRFNKYIEFSDYSEDELYDIFELNLKKYDYVITDTAQIILKKYLNKAVMEKDSNFGNARFVRNLFEKVLERQANRLSTEINLTTEKLSEITAEDII